MSKIIRPATHAEWLECRKGGIGSSEVGTILGLNPYETPYQLWRRKVGIDPPKEQNFAMKAGHYLEDAVARFWSDETGKEIIKRSAGDWLVVDEDKPFLRVSPDRTYWLPDAPHNDRNKGILECKTTQMDVDADNVPQHWFCQLQYQLGVAEYTEGNLAWLTAGRKFGYAHYAFDPEFYKWMIEEVERFWVDNIKGGIEPQPINVEDVLLRNPRHVAGKQVAASDQLLADIAALKDVKVELAALDLRKKELEGAVKMAMEDAETLVNPATAEVLATWKAAKDSEKFDEKRFKAEKPELYYQYQQTIAGTRRFLIK